MNFVIVSNIIVRILEFLKWSLLHRLDLWHLTIQSIQNDLGKLNGWPNYMQWKSITIKARHCLEQ